MNTCFFVSDLHGKMSRYEALFKAIKKEKPDFVFLGGDLLPHHSVLVGKSQIGESNFIKDFLLPKFYKLRKTLDCAYPEVFLIPGNDDHRTAFEAVADGEKTDLWRNLHNQCVVIGKYRLYGYACVPPTPFMLKDWDRFDISKEVEPGNIAPADGFHSMPPDHDPQNATILSDLQTLAWNDEQEFSIYLFHSPPFQTLLDHANTKGADPQGTGINVGSKAIRRLIDERQPYITMHGHIHESVGITGHWQQTLGRTISFSAAHDGPELSLIRFDLHDPYSATRRLIST